MENSEDWEEKNWQIEDFTTALKGESVETIAKTVYLFGLWYRRQNYFKEAVTYFQNSLSLHQKLNKIKEISLTRAELLHCHMQMYQRERIEKFLKNLYQLKQIVNCVVTDPSLNFAEHDALSYHSEVGHGFLKMKHYEKALEFLKISLGIAMSKDILENEMHCIMLYRVSIKS